MAPTTMPPATSVAIPTAEQISALAARSLARESGTAFQSLLAASLDALARLRRAVSQAEKAALCLSQREHAHTVASDLAAAQEALRAGIADEARCLRSGTPTLPDALRGLLRPDRQKLADAARAVRAALRPEAEERTGWFVATAHAVEALGETAAHLNALADAQPPASAAHELGADMALFLRERRDTLLGDIARLVD